MNRIIVAAWIVFSGFTGFTQKELTLKDAVMQQYGRFYPDRTVMVEWIPGTKTYSYLSADYQTLKMGNVKKSASTDLLNTGDMAKMTGETFNYVNVMEWKDENHFYTSAGNKYFLINAATKTADQLAVMPENAENAKLCSVNGKVGYTIDNNFYIQDGEKQIQVTNLGDQIVSGKAIARSEFGITDGIFWSTTGKYVAFYQKDESNVADYPLLDITTRTGSLNSIKYPMAGQGSEKSAVGIYDLETGKTVYVKPTGDPEDYLTNFGWGPKDEFFYIAEVNRDQNHMKLNKYKTSTGELVKTLFEEKNDKWVEPEHPVYFISDNEFIWLSERDGFMNMYLYSAEGEMKKQLTSNKWVTQEIVGHNAGVVYFVGTGELPTETQYFKVEVATGKQTQLTKGGTHHASFASDFSYMFDSWSDVNTPNVEAICDNNGKQVREVLKADNKLADYKIGTAEYGTIKAGDGKTDLYYRLIKPSDFDASKKYPVLIYVYGGPHAQLVTNSWYGGASLWMQWMAEQGYLVYTVDGRGSDNRGFEFESVIHRQLGTVEMEDQMKGVEYLKSLPYVDGERLAVHGWSFGGFMTTSLMLRQDDVFNVGVAGGPVTDWQYYEIMYGERYMDRPEQNEKGYADNRLMNYVENLKGKLLLIHGTVDDVVVMQHNLALVKAFVDAGVQMDFFPYPMHPHNVRGKDRVHLMEKVLTYIIENNN
ncbi:MAG: DPP IV N-terminal domain-containing protein [Crocinitomicaceae bacterium]|nr:DPP IV N-terminal domain-containing protein [Crocinitomicaceae bacterium]